MKAIRMSIAAIVLSMLVCFSAWAAGGGARREDCYFSERLRADIAVWGHVFGDEEATVKPHETSIKTVLEKELQVGIRPLSGLAGFDEFRFLLDIATLKHWDADDAIRFQLRGLYPLRHAELGSIADRICLGLGAAWHASIGGRSIPSHGRTTWWTEVLYAWPEVSLFGKPLQIDIQLVYYVDAKPLGMVRRLNDGHDEGAAPDLLLETNILVQWKPRNWLVPFLQVSPGLGTEDSWRLNTEAGVRFPLDMIGRTQAPDRGDLRFWQRIEPEIKGRFSRPFCRGRSCVATEAGIAGVRVKF